MWSKQVGYFKDYHCLIPDLPEHGKSINEGNISIKDSASHIAELIEKHANGGKANLVGHSLGAKITVELLSIRPELISHAVIASALCRPIPFMKLSHKPFVYRLTISMLKSKWVASLAVKQFKFPDKALEENCLKEFQELTSDALYRIYNELYQNLKLPQGLGKVNVPTLVIAGEKESKAMRQSVIDIVNTIPNSEGILMKKGLHTYPWVLHENFNKTIEQWINDKQVANDFIIHLPNTVSIPYG
ncbi:putative hydrolase or acyltransferase of alpha/beta superfamily [Candidatus Desulfosporosinus infrequens]|uniref:Putative hydrolase or acyltransferase of alpha/beta superfamily n=1 Tax=Candidatus Desulfosporosinus infrequens TaxID=2043169 RepID=A0A2U3KAM5_9FIRM|nr:putative hydrolase or acyltransferase of alpha/beta superfamily [Candidatus Desulfosporosinus infrequens]